MPRTRTKFLVPSSVRYSTGDLPSIRASRSAESSRAVRIFNPPGASQSTPSRYASFNAAKDAASASASVGRRTPLSSRWLRQNARSNGRIPDTRRLRIEEYWAIRSVKNVLGADIALHDGDVRYRESICDLADRGRDVRISVRGDRADRTRSAAHGIAHGGRTSRRFPRGPPSHHGCGPAPLRQPPRMAHRSCHREVRPSTADIAPAAGIPSQTCAAFVPRQEPSAQASDRYPPRDRTRRPRPPRVSGGACQSATTRNFGNARFTQYLAAWQIDAKHVAGDATAQLGYGDIVARFHQAHIDERGADVVYGFNHLARPVGNRQYARIEGSSQMDFTEHRIATKRWTQSLCARLCARWDRTRTPGRVPARADTQFGGFRRRRAKDRHSGPPRCRHRCTRSWKIRQRS